MGLTPQSQPSGPIVIATTIQYRPWPSTKLQFAATVPTTAGGVALGALSGLTGIPTFVDAAGTHVPNHVMIQVPSSAANSVWFCYDDQATCVVGPPSLEMQPGQTWIFENAQQLLSIETNSSLVFIASGSTVITVAFFV